MLRLLHYNPEAKEIDGVACVGPHEVAKILYCADGSDPGTLNIHVRFKLIDAWELRSQCPQYRRCRTILEMRGGDIDKMYYNLVKLGLENKTLSESDSDSDAGAENSDPKSPKRARRQYANAASPMSKNPTDEEREEKKKLKELAWDQREGWMKKVEEWQNDMKELLGKLTSGGCIPERDEHDVAQFCTDRGAAIKEGKRKAAEARAAEAASAQKKRCEEKKPDLFASIVEAADAAEIARLKAEIVRIQAEAAKIQANAQGLQERAADLQTANTRS